jgi:hypothetical protein
LKNQEIQRNGGSTAHVETAACRRESAGVAAGAPRRRRDAGGHRGLNDPGRSFTIGSLHFARRVARFGVDAGACNFSRSGWLSR